LEDGMYFENKIDRLKVLLEKSRDSVDEELNILLNGLVYQRNAKVRIEELKELLADIEKELIRTTNGEKS
jgi:hypothetical protein